MYTNKENECAGKEGIKREEEQVKFLVESLSSVLLIIAALIFIVSVYVFYLILPWPLSGIFVLAVLCLTPYFLVREKMIRYFCRRYYRLSNKSGCSQRDLVEMKFLEWVITDMFGRLVCD